jgi:tetraacyldisaccharide 4'-kinase
LSGRSVTIASAIGDPSAFERQLRGGGAEVRHVHRFADHHKFSPSEVIHIATMAEATAGVVCTLKDAVKLMPLWPREAPPLWYLSQSVVVDRGADVMDRVLTRVLSARAATAPTAG